jgi:hypothetical protein
MFRVFAFDEDDEGFPVYRPAARRVSQEHGSVRSDRHASVPLITMW